MERSTSAHAVEPAVAWDLSCPDWASRLRQGRSLIPDLPLDKVRGEKAVRVFNKLRLADVPGTPTMAEAGGDWFRDIVRALFGSLDPVTKQRMIRELFLLVAKKNAKTTQGALLMLTALLLNERPHASLIMTAPVQDVAQLAFDAASGAIALDPVLDRKLHVREHIKTIVHRETKAELAIMTFDPAVMTGQKPVAALIDEVHVISKMSKASSALRQLRGGMIPFPEAFLAFITTQSEEPPAGVFKAELQRARDIRDGKRRGSMLPVLYELPKEIQISEDKQWKDPKLWHMVTPNVGRSITIPRLVEDMADAEAKGLEELIGWASQHLNVEIGIALSLDRWAGTEFWQQCAIAPFTFDEFLERCEVITAGIDGGGLDDMLGLAFIGRESQTGDWLLWVHAWIHPIVLERRKSEKEKFEDYKRDGDLTIVDVIGQDIEEVADYIRRAEDSGKLDKIGVDQAGIGAIVDAIVDREIDQERIVGIPQGWRMVSAIKTTERRCAEKSIKHAGRPMMTWCVGNAKAEPRGNAVIITKQVSGAAKIDPLLATFNAVTLMSLNPQAKKSFWEARA
jgi:phage terminase large subunit-like protein